MKRKEFIALSVGLTGMGSLLRSCSTDKKIKGKIIGSSSVGHLLRDNKYKSPVTIEKTDTVIVGAGISGLSAARYLFNNGKKNFIILDLEQAPGGNAASGKNEVSAYPWGAHYIPIPNNGLDEYVEFLQECNVITGIDAKGLPLYNEDYLCFDPQERLYINGRWQDGLVPHFGLPEPELKQIASFLELMDEYRHLKGSDGKDAFAIPVDHSSKDPAFVKLDNMTMADWMTINGFTSKYLHDYVNYCCRDDFGTPHAIASAWVGIHYFASRKGIAGNASHGDVLTWPEGNGFLVNQLHKNFPDNIYTSSLATSVYKSAAGVVVEYLDVKTNSLKAIEAKQCILSVPQFIAGRLLKDDERLKQVKEHFHYAPWMVANLLVNSLDERTGPPLSWDNVIYESQSLGYVEATHELLQQAITRRNLTYYLPLTELPPEEERKAAQKKTHEDWVNLVMDDLVRVHPNIRKATEEINVTVWGHAMAQPRPQMIHGTTRHELAASINNRIHFAHTDLAGVSIFEEGFYQGIAAAKKVIHFDNVHE